MRAFGIFCPFLIAVPAFAQVEPARIGCFIDPQQQLREVHGTAGNFIVSGPLRRGVLAAVCTESLTIIKTDNNIEANGVVYAAPPGPAAIDPDGLVCYTDGSCVRFGNAPAKPPAQDPVTAEGAFLVAGNRRIELPSEILAIEYLGPGWLRVRLAGGSQAAFSRERASAYMLPATSLAGAERRTARSAEVLRVEALRRQVQARGATR